MLTTNVLADPITSTDLAGSIQVPAPIINVGRWALQHPFDAAGIALEGVALGACIVATEGLCSVIAAGALWGGAALAAAGEYQDYTLYRERCRVRGIHTRSWQAR